MLGVVGLCVPKSFLRVQSNQAKIKSDINDESNIITRKISRASVSPPCFALLLCTPCRARWVTGCALPLNFPGCTYWDVCVSFRYSARFETAPRGARFGAPVLNRRDPTHLLGNHRKRKSARRQFSLLLTPATESLKSTLTKSSIELIGFKLKMCFAFFPFMFFVCNGSFPQLDFPEPWQAYRTQITPLFNKIEPPDQTQRESAWWAILELITGLLMRGI